MIFYATPDGRFIANCDEVFMEVVWLYGMSITSAIIMYDFDTTGSEVMDVDGGEAEKFIIACTARALAQELRLMRLLTDSGYSTCNTFKHVSVVCNTRYLVVYMPNSSEIVYDYCDTPVIMGIDGVISNTFSSARERVRFLRYMQAYRMKHVVAEKAPKTSVYLAQLLLEKINVIRVTKFADICIITL